MKKLEDKLVLLQGKYDELNKQKTEFENLEIIGLIRGAKISTENLTDVITAYRNKSGVPVVALVARTLRLKPEAIATQVLAQAAANGAQVVPSAEIAAICMDRERLRVLAHEELGLPTDPDQLAALAGGRPELLAAALVRASLDDDLVADLRSR